MTETNRICCSTSLGNGTSCIGALELEVAHIGAVESIDMSHSGMSD